jgi:hypothetical protein
MVSAAGSRRQGRDDPCEMGHMTVFFTPAMISGTLSMKRSPLVAWNFVVGAVYVLSVGPAAYGTVSAGEQDGISLSAP